MTADLPAIIAGLDAGRLRDEARSAPTVVALLRALAAKGGEIRQPDGYGGMEASCYSCGGSRPFHAEHEADCPYAAARAFLDSLDGTATP